MNKPKLLTLISVALFVALLVAVGAQTKPRPLAPLEEERSDPLRGIVYYRHPVTHKLALYVAYELSPNRLYRFEVTDDGMNFETIEVLSTAGNTNDIYESFNVPNPCDGALWPRVVDLGASP